MKVLFWARPLSRSRGLISVTLVLEIRAWYGRLTSVVVWALRLILRLASVVPGAALIIESLRGMLV